jgi:hypothetical protein
MLYYCHDASCDLSQNHKKKRDRSGTGAGQKWNDLVYIFMAIL